MSSWESRSVETFVWFLLRSDVLMPSANVGGKAGEDDYAGPGDARLAGDSVWRIAIGQSVAGKLRRGHRV